MKAIICILVALAAMAAGCKKDASGPVDTSVDIRILNATPWTFFDCRADPTGISAAGGGSNEHNYGQVNVDAYSAYHTFPQAYPYASIRLTMNNQQYILQPIDFVGEKLLAKGRYTFKITYAFGSDRLNLELIKE